MRRRVRSHRDRKDDFVYSPTRLEYVDAPKAKRADGLSGRMNHLQQTIGNARVTQLVGRLPDRPAAFAGGAKLDDGPSGSIPDMEPEQKPSHEKGRGELKEDAGGSHGGSTGSGTAIGARNAGPLTIEPGSVDLNVKAPELEQETGRSRADAAQAGTVTNTFSNPDTSPSPKSFGSESFKAGFKNAAFTTEDGKVTVDFTLDINCPWGTNGGTKTDVPAATDGVVTKDNYKQIVSDLTPVLKEKSWRAPRSKFWSEAICKRHERFHSTDDKAWSEGAGKTVVTNYLAGKTVNPATAAADVNTHLAKAVEAMDTANFQFYTGGAASYLSYAGEERAFGDGKQPYLDLAAGVKAQGELLESAHSMGKRIGAALAGLFGWG